MKKIKTKSFLLKSLLVLIVFIITLVLSFSLIGNDSSKQTQFIESEINIDSDKTWDLVQKWRTENNLKKFEKNDRLCIVAQDLANDKDIKKISFKDKYWNYPYRIGQVSIYNAESEEDVVNEWINASKNVEILKKDWKYSCLICEKRNCAQIFSNLSD